MLLKEKYYFLIPESSLQGIKNFKLNSKNIKPKFNLSNQREIFLLFKNLKTGKYLNKLKSYSIQ